MQILPLLFAALSPAHAQSQDGWEATLDEVVPAIVAIRVTGTRDFDTENARSSVGTGFVVDAERGILLTNRHMVHAGPVIADALFIDETEVDLHPIYRDPVHDFGFYRFDPDELRYLAHREISLAPESARVGLNIRVVGNDAGEKISILDGTLSRLDRPAPSYGRDTYNDFNTFYMQAASGTSGGSSGSPVIDINGHAVALNAGGSRQAASSFYLPLDRVVRALELIQAGEPVTRGTLQTTLEYTSFPELERLGLSQQTQDTFRDEFPGSTGMLVVGNTVPDGPAHGLLQPGDIVVSIGGERVQTFVPWEATLDDSVGETLDIVVERRGTRVPVQVTVQDLHSITPDEYLEFGRSVVHELSYQQARNFSTPVQGVYVVQSGYLLGRAGIPETAMIDAIDGEAVTDLDDVERLLASKPQGARVSVRFHPLSDPNRQFVQVVVMDRTWYTMQRCERDDTSGYWPCTPSPEAPAASEERRGSAFPYASDSKVGDRLAPSLVMVDVDIPHPVSGVKDFNYQGAGVVVDAERGWVLVDRDTVPVNLADIEITFAGTVRVPGRVVYLHPIHNMAIISYDPSLVTDVPIQAATLLDEPLHEGQDVWQVGLAPDQRVLATRTSVSKVDSLYVGASGSPRFRDINVEIVDITEGGGTLGGVLADKKGRVYAQWSSFYDPAGDDRGFYGMPTVFWPDWLLEGGEPEPYCFIGVEFGGISLADAVDTGLSDAAAMSVLRASPIDRVLLKVNRVTGGSPAQAAGLRSGDVISHVRGAGIDDALTRMTQVERLSTASCSEDITFTVLRDRAEQDLTIRGMELPVDGVDRVVSFAGLVAHDPHVDVAIQEQEVPRGVYLTWLWYGSPAYRYGLRPTRQVLSIDGVPTPTLDAFLMAVRDLQDHDSVQLLLLNRQGRESVETLRVDLHYWPTQLLERDASGTWTRSAVEPTP